MFFDRPKNVHVSIPHDALTAIFDECDRFDADETGGRLVGSYSEKRGRLEITVSGVIGPGTQARRTPTSFFQDGEEQERIFRSLESKHPALEHLGNWHTHHVNGYPTLSGGDIETYRRTVNHANHNTDFFYALLVVEKKTGKKSGDRYAVKHYVLRRDDEHVYEVPSKDITVSKSRVIWPTTRHDEATPPAPSASETSGAPTRAYDRDILAEFYGAFRPFRSSSLGTYWRGPLELADGSTVEVLAVENTTPTETSYSFLLHKPPENLQHIGEELANRSFPSARAALIEGERACNRALHQRTRRSHD
jgi:hypothetical protein